MTNAFRELFSSLFIASAGEEQKRWYDGMGPRTVERHLSNVTPRWLSGKSARAAAAARFSRA